jgi:hypothetical protein
MTLTAALRAALATPSDLGPLRKMSAREGADVAEAYRNLTAAMLCVSLRDADYLVEHVPIILDVLQGAGAPLPDLAAIMREASADPEIPRSAEWSAAAERLAAWADGQTTPEEPAPWDEPTVMSDEDIAALVGL